jgi:DNA-sulfur modification-associated
MTSARRRVAGLKVRQWLKEWDHVVFDTKERRRRPEPHFYLFSLNASSLKALSGISRRTTQTGVRRSEDLGIQRRHDESRSADIRDFIRYGYPWSALKLAQRDDDAYRDLRKPGWLPTAIVVNILGPEDHRHGKGVDTNDLIKIEAKDGDLVDIILPGLPAKGSWSPTGVHPIEVIDGQHRLWAFEDSSDEEFDLPVVAFYGLDISWQAYLFWTINITPKKINPSLAFDLYPLLRTEDWLEKYDGPRVYRETRAQELTESLWAFPESPWHNRINMLGDPGLRGQSVTQAAWIRSLLATCIKPSEGRRITIGGLFGAPVGEHQTALPWTRAQQAAFLIYAWQDLKERISSQALDWAQSLRGRHQPELLNDADPAFAGAATLLNTDQGVRGMLYVTNDLCFLAADELELADWEELEVDAMPSNDTISTSLSSLKKTRIASFISEMNQFLANFDWRTSAAPGLSEEERQLKSAFRGSGGYKLLRQRLLEAVAIGHGMPSSAAQTALKALGYL